MTLRVLLVHPHFPSQLIAVLEALESRPDVRCAAIGMNAFERPGLIYRRYTPAPAAIQNDIVLDDLAARIRAAEAAAAAARALSYDGFVPDLIVAHPGWGEALYLKDLFPRARLVCYCEYYYLRTGGELDFDPEFPVTTPEILHRLRGRNAIMLASIDEAETCIAPTRWQRSTFPALLQPKIQVVHEGIDLDRLDGTSVQPGQSGRTHLTFAARHLEPHRGFHTFMRALPAILHRHPDLAVSVVGLEAGGYGASPPDGRTWKDVLLDEAGDGIDHARVAFTGALTHDAFLALIDRSTVHVYLTYPFVLSWSVLEIASRRAALVLSGTEPVTEFFADGDTARMADMLSPESVAEGVADLLVSSGRRRRLGTRARAMLQDRKLTRRQGRAGWLAALGLGTAA